MRNRFVYHRSMDVEPSLAALGALIGVPARANILNALFDGRALTATELAIAAGITSQTTSSHLNKLVEAKLIVSERHGRFRYYKLAGPEIAEALEPLTLISPHRPTPIRGQSKSMQHLHEARFCYDHIAGKLGVLMTEAMLKKGYLSTSDRDFDITEKGKKFFAALGIDLAELKKQRRVFARRCLDWSERKPHVSGSLGAEIASTFIAKEWMKRTKHGRQLNFTDEGRGALQRHFSIKL